MKFLPFYALLKRVVFALLLILPSILQAQNESRLTKEQKIINAAIISTGSNGSDFTLDCTARSLSGCNYITNNNFTPSGYSASNPIHFGNPFGNGLVPDWFASHGTPQISDGVYDFVNSTWIYLPSSPPSPATGYAMAATIPDQFSPYHEGFGQKIPALTEGDKYLFSYFAKLQRHGLSSLTLQSYDIVLLHCEDAQNIFTYPSATLPDLTGIDHQKIVCQYDVTDNWQQFVTTFTANSDYDVIWIYPFNGFTRDATTMKVDMAYPELIDVEAFSAGPAPTPSPGNCEVVIGPATPNCGVVNAVFTWHGPNGQTIAAPSNQQINIDANDPLQMGTWTLKMTIPGTVTPNGICSTSPVILATVVVPPCCPTPTISPAGSIEYYYPGAEFGKTLTFTSSSSTGNQWYVDGILVSGATSQTFNYYWETAIGENETHYISVKAGTCSSTPTSLSFINYGATCPPPLQHLCFPVVTARTYCENSTDYLTSFNLGASGTYSWQLIQPGSLMSITSQSQNVAAISIGAIVGTDYYVDIIAKSQLGGVTKYFEYMVGVVPDFEGINTSGGCISAPGVMTVSITGSGKDNEFYDFGAGTVLSVTPAPVFPYYAGTNTVYLSGSVSPKQIVVQLNSISTYSMDFSDNINYGNCFKTIKAVPSASCFQRILKPQANAEKNLVINEQGKSSISYSANIETLNIFNVNGQLLKRLTTATDIYRAINTNRLDGVVPGIYIYKLYYRDKTWKVIKKQVF